jgi:hypothetical protein
MENVRLELDFLDLDRRKERWNIYFVVATDHPDDPTKMAISVVPDGLRIPLRNPSDNYYSFQGEGDNADGLMIMRRKMPELYSVRARMWMMHDRQGIRNTGDILKEISDIMGGEGIAQILGNASPWLVVGRAALGLVGTAMKKINDRELGFVTLDEYFNPDGEDDPEKSFEKKLSTGYGSLGYSWILN